MKGFAICNEIFRDLDFTGACAAAARHGYRGLEIAPYTLGDPAALSPVEVAGIGRIVRDHGLVPVGLHWLLVGTNGLHLTHPDPGVRQRTFDHARRLVDLCHGIGGEVLVWGSPKQRSLEPDWSREDAFTRCTEFFRDLAPHLEAAGLTLALEPLPENETNFLTTPEEAVELATAIGSPAVRLILDVKAMAADPRPMPDIVRKFLPWTAHFHANDPNLRGPGMGDVDFPPVARELIAGNYAGWVSVETFDTSIPADGMAEESLRNLRAAF